MKALPNLDQALATGLGALAARRKDDGHWCFELEADVTIPAEYILMNHFLGRVDEALDRRMAAYIRSLRTAEGGWPLFAHGPFDISASVKGYFALKAAGDPIDAPHMAEARAAILAHGGAARANVFTRILLALYGEVPWKAVPVMPVEIMLLPEWSPFHLDKVSYWSRTVIVPLLAVLALKPRPANPKGIHVAELFVEPPETVRDWHHHPDPGPLTAAFRHLDTGLRAAQPFMPKKSRQRAIDEAVAWVKERLNGENGLGAIFPAMVNAALMFHALDMQDELAVALDALARLVVDGERTYCQPCFSPVWDTALAAHAILEAGTDPGPALDWLTARQITDVKGDWARQRPQAAPGGWAFQYTNPHYPDLDDTAVVVMALHRAEPQRFAPAITRAEAWVRGLQCRNGGWGAFDAENTAYHLNHIPFADHGALLDPPTADVTARCLGMLAQLGAGKHDPAVAAAIAFLLREQEDDGSWFGRWGTNYIYGTWSVLSGLNAVGFASDYTPVRRAVDWLTSRQQADGGWGESGESYWPERKAKPFNTSTPSQTAWAVLGLMAAGEVHSDTVERGIRHLAETQNTDGSWSEEHYTAVGFPRVFYLRYHGYAQIFPVWALARYRVLTQGNRTTTQWGL
ncbi:MAG TPA: squalene--hopene cyclase [Magnetospirillum sp.]|jgi:squalene-hopene/tetraprenyl-beta-curcumene cyclase|nr:squalene--hopene cyclase [Magnetospirillum sp.]